MRKPATLFFMSCVLACAGCVGTTRLQAFDTMILVGHDATLRAKLERGGLFLSRPDVRGAKIKFEILHLVKTAEQKKEVYLKLCDAITDHDGIASVAMEGFFEGTHLIRATYLAVPRVKAFSRVFAITPQVPILVFDIDHTIADVSVIGFLTQDPEVILAVPGALDALLVLSRKYLIVYLTARDDTFLIPTMRWLRLRGFPDGPVFFSDFSKQLFLASAAKFKTEKLTAWRKAGFNLVAGIGDTTGDAQAYLSAGMKALILNASPEALPPGATAVDSWYEIFDILSQ